MCMYIQTSEKCIKQNYVYTQKRKEKKRKQNKVSQCPLFGAGHTRVENKAAAAHTSKEGSPLAGQYISIAVAKLGVQMSPKFIA